MFEIDAAEADKLADACDNVLSQYVSIDIDPRTQAWVNLLFVAGGIYAPKVLAAMAERKSKPKPVEPVKPTETTPVNATMKKIIPGVGEIEVPLS